MPARPHGPASPVDGRRDRLPARGHLGLNRFGQTGCLNMIVKNEALVIARCLSAVRPLIDSWVIVDTGSSDGTQEIVREVLGDLPGELIERSWRDFASNR